MGGYLRDGPCPRSREEARRPAIGSYRAPLQHRAGRDYLCTSMSKYSAKVKARPSKRPKSFPRETRGGTAPAHQTLVNNLVHVFVDDQNLFWGIVNADRGIGYRFDFGRLMLAAARSSQDQPRGVKTAYVAGVVPDDDTFWAIADSRGWTVRRGYLGAKNRSKQDDAWLITDLMKTLYEEQGPSTIVLVAGDADYMPPLKTAIEKGWRVEVLFISSGLSAGLAPVTHELRKLSSGDIELYRD